MDYWKTWNLQKWNLPVLFNNNNNNNQGIFIKFISDMYGKI